MSSSQMLKGILEGCILSIIGKGETYGYEMVEKLNAYGFNMVKEGSIYPILIRMKKENLLTTTKKKLPSGGPSRKYYKLTDSGEEELQKFKQRWKAMSASVDCLIEEEG
ncbi:PadR family transcriptional regulator [Halobacillus salinus]|uniref:PadR family transcriptional regulator n=1 Tax=Halobacillus salinus TaxID=192814 RepID=UPI0009A5FFFB|nr:PadR family transcriptional regulator [Halobacillus salinus]